MVEVRQESGVVGARASARIASQCSASASARGARRCATTTTTTSARAPVHATTTTISVRARACEVVLGQTLQ